MKKLTFINGEFQKIKYFSDSWALKNQLHCTKDFIFKSMHLGLIYKLLINIEKMVFN